MLVLIGESGSGKSKFEKALKDGYGFYKIVSYTTRPIRKGETDGIDYHFISSEEFKEMENLEVFAEKVFYNNNSYSIAKEDCLDDSIVVVEPNGLEQLLAVKGLNIVSFYIKASMLTRGIRMLRRGDKISNIFKRLKNDLKIFKNIRKKANYVIDNNSNFAFLFKSGCSEILENYDKRCCYRKDGADR
jgi:guanylate kinase